MGTFARRSYSTRRCRAPVRWEQRLLPPAQRHRLPQRRLPLRRNRRRLDDRWRCVARRVQTWIGRCPDHRRPRSAEARQGRPPRGYNTDQPAYYPPQRSLNPYGAAGGRSTGVQTDPFDDQASGGGSNLRGQSRGAGGGRGGRGSGGYAGPIDPYGGYTGSAKPIGGPSLNPYGGGGPYGTGSLHPFGSPQGSAGRGRSGPPDDPGLDGAAAPNPFAPYPPAPVPYIQPPGLRFN